MPAGRRKFTKTRYPGIYAGALPGQKPDRYTVAYRIRGVGQRTKTLHTLKEALGFQGKVRDPSKQRELRGLERGKVTLDASVQEYLARRRHLKESTRERYLYASRLILAGRLGQRRIVEISRDDVEAWVSDVLSAEVPPGSYEKAVALLHAVMAEALKDGKVSANPVHGIHLPKRSKREPFPLTAEQVTSISEEVPLRHRTLVVILGFIGLRVGEASALQVRDLDLDHGMLRVSRSSPEVGGRKVMGSTKTDKSRRSIVLADEFVDMLREHLAQFGAKTPTGQLDPYGFVFTHMQGGQIRQNNWRARVFHPACERLGIWRPDREGKHQYPRVHDLRHSAASIAAQAGFTMHEVKDLLGHANITTTVDTYSHLFDDGRRAKAAALGKLAAEAAKQSTRTNVIQLPPRSSRVDAPSGETSHRGSP